MALNVGNRAEQREQLPKWRGVMEAQAPQHVWTPRPGFSADAWPAFMSPANEPFKRPALPVLAISRT
jgi:hypothetical protein